MKKLLKRLLLVVIAVPALVISIMYVPAYNFIAFNCIIIVLIAIGGFELARMINKTGIEIDLAATSALSATIAILTYIYSLAIIQFNIYALILFLIIISQFLAITISKTGDWDKCMKKTLARVFALVYVGILPSTVIILGKLDSPKFAYLVFFSTVFANDSFAYIAGMTIGRFTPKPFKVSPNKSLGGFIGGFLGTLGLAIACYYIMPEFFNEKIINAIIISIAVFILGTGGDLFASALKRSANVKDSGKIMLGRGGVLDSVDSIIFTAPFFYFFISIIQGQV